MGEEATAGLSGSWTEVPERPEPSQQKWQHGALGQPWKEHLGGTGGFGSGKGTWRDCEALKISPEETSRWPLQPRVKTRAEGGW